MRTYADYSFYEGKYLLGRCAKIPDSEFEYWSLNATTLIRNRTFGRVDLMETIPEDVKLCCCEVAEKLYLTESCKDGNGRILQSYQNDGESGVYKTTDMTESSVNASIDKIIKRWLMHTGLMYCGVIH